MRVNTVAQVVHVRTHVHASLRTVLNRLGLDALKHSPGGCDVQALIILIGLWGTVKSAVISRNPKTARQRLFRPLHWACMQDVEYASVQVSMTCVLNCFCTYQPVCVFMYTGLCLCLPLGICVRVYECTCTRQRRVCETS